MGMNRHDCATSSLSFGLLQSRFTCEIFWHFHFSSGLGHTHCRHCGDYNPTMIEWILPLLYKGSIFETFHKLPWYLSNGSKVEVDYCLSVISLLGALWSELNWILPLLQSLPEPKYDRIGRQLRKMNGEINTNETGSWVFSSRARWLIWRKTRNWTASRLCRRGRTETAWLDGWRLHLRFTSFHLHPFSPPFSNLWQKADYTPDWSPINHKGTYVLPLWHKKSFSVVV